MIGNNDTLEPVTDDPAPAYGVDDEGDLLAKFGKWDKELEDHWDEWKVEASTCFDFMAGRQWSKEEEAAMLEGPDGSTRAPVTFNRIAPTIDAVSGAEIQGRQQVQYYPREAGDTGVADVLTQGVDFLMDRCDGNEEDSEAFRDCLVCGVGIREVRVDADEGEMSLLKERVDPLEVLFDPSSRKACFEDARYVRREKRMSRDAFYEEWPDDEPAEGPDISTKKPVIVDPRVRYKNGMEGDGSDNEVTVREYQWKERVDRYKIPHPNTGELIDISAEEHEKLVAYDPSIPSQRFTSWRYRRAFVSGQQILSVEDMEQTEKGHVGSFSYIAITGKRDRNKGWWYGLVRPMIGPQKFANKFFTQILHIINTNAKGGIMIEEGAVEDIRQFETSWANPQRPTIVADGALSQPGGARIQNKPPVPYPSGSDRLMQVSIDGIRDVTGVNQEILGMADRQQAGVLEHMRKQSAYGILAAFFDNHRRSLKIEGRRVLKLIQLYMPGGELVRIVGKSGSPEYVPMALDPNVTRYDVSVDEAPAGPNQKERTFGMLVQLLPLLQNADLSPEIWADIARYSPLPASLADKIAKGLIERAEAEAQSAPQQQAMMQAAQAAEIAEKRGEAKHNEAQAVSLMMDAQSKAMEAKSASVLRRADAAKKLSEIVQATISPRGM